MKNENGFTLIEVMLVVTVVGIVASIAVPSIARARASATETSTIAALKAIHSAQAIYATSCGTGFYAPSVASLGVPGKGKAPFIGPEFSANSIDREGYNVRFSAGTVVAKAPQTCNGVAAGKALQTFFIGADPLATGTAGATRHFGMSSDGTIYESTKRISAFYTGVPPKPAKPIQ